MDAKTRLLAVAKAYCAETGLSLARVATLAQNQGSFFKRLEAGSSCTVETYEKVLRWLSDNWPRGLAWPDSVERPPRKRAA